MYLKSSLLSGSRNKVECCTSYVLIRASCLSISLLSTNGGVPLCTLVHIFYISTLVDNICLLILKTVGVDNGCVNISICKASKFCSTFTKLPILLLHNMYQFTTIIPIQTVLARVSIVLLDKAFSSISRQISVITEQMSPKVPQQ